MSIHDLLPPAVFSQEIQTLRVMANIHRIQGRLIFVFQSIERILFIDDLDRYNELMNLSERSDRW
jgi:hypothetical protein